MNLPSKILEHAVNELSQFPGIGKKTALRMVIHLMKQPEESVGSLAKAIINLKTNLQFCSICHNVAESDTCDICKKDINQDSARYHCNICDDFDACHGCFDKHKHRMFKILWRITSLEFH